MQQLDNSTAESTGNKLLLSVILFMWMEIDTENEFSCSIDQSSMKIMISQNNLNAKHRYI